MNACVWCGTALSMEGLCDRCYDLWPKCAVPACQAKCCLRLKSKYCWPHTPGSGAEARENIRETEDEPCAVEER